MFKFIEQSVSGSVSMYNLIFDNIENFRQASAQEKILHFVCISMYAELIG